MWVCDTNLPFNLGDEPWSMAIAHQIDMNAKSLLFDHAAGFLWARVTVEVDKPLRRWILTEEKMHGPYDILYENVPHFCFSCGRLGHSDLLCPTPGTRDENGDFPFGKGLRAPDDRKRSASSEGSMREHSISQNSKAKTRNSSLATKGAT